MPPLKVEYAKSGRSRCSLKECNKFIEKGELRVGTAVMMPGMDDPSFKWRHICCFTARQVKNSGGSVDNIEGFETLTEADQRLVTKMMTGALVGDHSLLGNTGTAASASSAPKEGHATATAAVNVSETPSKPPSKKRAPTKRVRESGGGVRGDNCDGAASDATDDYDLVDTVAAATPATKPPCPYGTKCFRKNPNHFLEFDHVDSAHKAEAALASTSGQSTTTTTTATSTTVVITTAKKKDLPNAQPTPPATALAASDVRAVPTAAPAVGPSSAAKQPAVEDGQTGRCPYGDLCFRTDAAHVARFHS